MDAPITRAEHMEFSKRIEAALSNTNAQIKTLTATVDSIKSLAVSVEKLAVNMEHMSTTLDTHGQKLEALEDKDGKMWRDIVKYVITTLIGVAIGALF